MSDGARPEAIDLVRLLDAHVVELITEVRGLRQDLGRVYGRDREGRLRVEPPVAGAPAAVPKREWTPGDVQQVVGKVGEVLFGRPTGRRRR